MEKKCMSEISMPGKIMRWSLIYTKEEIFKLFYKFRALFYKGGRNLTMAENDGLQVIFLNVWVNF